MERRDFMGAVAAVFCGIVLPAPMREALVVPSEEIWTEITVMSPTIVMDVERWERDGNFWKLIKRVPAEVGWVTLPLDINADPPMRVISRLVATPLD